MFNANTALQQLGGSTGRLNAMIGAKNFVQCQEENWVRFQFMRGAANKANMIKIKLNSMDTYTVTFMKLTNKKDPQMGIRVPTVVEIKTVDHLYADQLKEFFESETKLYLSL